MLTVMVRSAEKVGEEDEAQPNVKWAQPGPFGNEATLTVIDLEKEEKLMVVVEDE